MASLHKMKMKAKRAGVPVAQLRAANSVDAVQELLDEVTGNGSASKTTARKAVKKATRVQKVRKARKSVAKPATRKSATKTKPAAKPKRKPAANRSAERTSAPARSRGTAKRRSTAKATKTTSGYVPKGGRALLPDDLDFSEDRYLDGKGWNPREGSPPDRIIRALRKFRGNREKVFDFLVDDIWDFVGKRMANGDKRTRDNAESMLRYRIARTAWQFAIQTDQHDVATNRVQYGTGDTGNGSYKPAKARKTAQKSTRRPVTRKTARKPATRASARKATRGRKPGRKARR